MQNAGRPVGAKSALARSHAQAHITAQVVQRHCRVALRCMFEHGAGDQFAFADKLALQAVLLDLMKAMAQPIVALVYAGHRVVAVVQVAKLQLSQTLSMVSSAMSRKVVHLPPVMEIMPDTPSRAAWSSKARAR